MKSSPMMENRAKRWIERIMIVALLFFMIGSFSVYRENLHQQLSIELRLEQIRAKDLTNEASNLEMKLAEHASTAAIKRSAIFELGMIPNRNQAEEIFIASAFEEPAYGIMGFFRLPGKK